MGLNQKFILTLFVGLLLLACNRKKEQIQYLTGYVADATTIKPIDKANIIFQSTNVSGGIYSTSFKTLSNTQTMATGVFNLNFEKSNGDQFRLIVNKPGYIEKRTLIDANDVNNNPFYNAPITVLYPSSIIKIKVKNISPETPSDFMFFRFLNANFDCECCDIQTKDFEGMNIDTESICTAYGNVTLNYKWQVTKNGTTSQFSGSIQTLAFDTTVIEVNY
jgi:hypothetical protein